MIAEFRVLGLTIELLWVNGLLLGFSLPQGSSTATGINLGPFCLCIYFEKPSKRCVRCGRNLRWGLHGTLWSVRLCDPPRTLPRCTRPGCSNLMTDFNQGLCDWHKSMIRDTTLQTPLP